MAKQQYISYIFTAYTLHTCYLWQYEQYDFIVDYF